MIGPAKLLSIILVTHTLVLGQEFKCPFTDYLNGCKCYPKSQSIVCNSSVTKAPELDLAKPSGVKVIKKLELIKTGFKLDFKGIIETLILRDINSFETNIKLLDNLHIYGDQINFTSLLHNPIEIKGQLSINGQQSDPINKDLFAQIGSPNIGPNEIILKGNGIEKIGEDAFSKFTNLHQLDLSNNKINKLVKGCLNFHPNQSVTIDLSDNKIESIEENIFETDAKLKIYLSNNNIKSLEPFQSLSNRSISVYLNNNPIHCDEDLKWVFKNKQVFKNRIIQAQCENFKHNDIFVLEDQLNPTTVSTQPTERSTIHLTSTLATIPTENTTSTSDNSTHSSTSSPTINSTDTTTTSSSDSTTTPTSTTTTTKTTTTTTTTTPQTPLHSN